MSRVARALLLSSTLFSFPSIALGQLPETIQAPEATQKAHRRWVNELVLSSDGALLLSGSWDHDAKLWSVKDGRLLAALKGIPKAVLVQRERGIGLDPTQGHHETVTALAFVPEHSLVVTGARDETVKLWSSETRQIVKTLEWRAAAKTLGGQDRPVRSLAVDHKAGRVYVSNSNVGYVSVWSLPEGDFVEEFSTRLPGPGITLSPDGGSLLSWTWEEVKRYSFEEKTVVQEMGKDVLGYDRVTAALYLPGGQLLATFGREARSPAGEEIPLSQRKGVVKLWNLPDWTPNKRLTESLDEAGDLASAQLNDHEAILVARGGNTIRIWSLPAGNLISTFEGSFESIALSRDATRLVSAIGSSIVVWNLEDGSHRVLADPLLAEE